MSPMNRLIDESTGEIDQIAFAEAVNLDASREWGGPNFPPRYQRKSEQWVADRAAAMQRNWRSIHAAR